jgi:hypothetical protein
MKTQRRQKCEGELTQFFLYPDKLSRYNQLIHMKFGNFLIRCT